MPSPHSSMQLLDYARGLSPRGIEDFHMRLLARQSNARKELLELLDQFVEAAARAEAVGLLRELRYVEIAARRAPRIERSSGS